MADSCNLPKLKVALLGDIAMQFLVTAIKSVGTTKYFYIGLFEVKYNQMERQFMNETSDLYRFDADYISAFLSTYK